MKGIVRRPLAVCCSIFLLLLFTAERFLTGLTLPLGAITLLMALAAFAGGWLSPPSRSILRKGLFWCVGIALAAALAFFSAWRVETGRDKTAAAFDGTTAQAVLTVTDIKYATTYSTTLTCRLESLDGQEMEQTGELYLPYAAALAAGDRITLPVTYTLLRPQGTLADCYALSQGLAFEAEGGEEGYRLLSQSDLFPETLFSNVRTALTRQFYRYLTDGETGLVSALLTGDRSGLSDELRNQFRNLGISHTLAVSGLHLGILFGSLLRVFQKLRLPRVLHLPILLPALLFYSGMVGSPSVLRAGGMLLILFAAHPFGRLRDPLTSLFTTVTAICLLSPSSVLDIGLLLSFFATWGILLIPAACKERLEKLPRLLRAPLSALVVTLSATLFTLPFSVWYFGEWAILSPLANLLLVPLITLLLYLTPILLLLSPVPPLATAPALLIRGLTALLRTAADFFGGSDHLMLPLSYPAITILALLTIALVIPLCTLKKTRPLTLAAAVLFLSLSGGYCVFHSYQLQEVNTILPFTDGENDCLLVRAGTRTLLIDHSEGNYAFLSSAIERGESDPLLRVDAILLTHYRYRQISALTRLLENGHIEYLVLPEPTEKDRNTALTLADRASRAGCKVRWYSPELNAIGYHDYEILPEFAADNTLRRVIITYGEEELVYSANRDSALPDALPGNFGQEDSG